METTAFLLSSWYSGATLLTLLLDRHPQIVSNGEGFPFTEDFQDFDCSCGQLLHGCEFYRFSAKHMLRESNYDPELFIRSPTYRKLPTLLRRLACTDRFPGPLRQRLLSVVPEYRKTTEYFVSAHLEFMDRALSYSGATVYLDGTKSLQRADLLLRHLAGNKHIWLLVKDCRGYCATVLRTGRLSRERVAEAAKEWKKYLWLAKRLAARYPEAKFRLIRYEDLCREPSSILGSLLESLGVSPDYDWTTVTRTPHVLGNKMRKSFNGEIRLSERWRDELDTNTEQAVIREAGDQMREHGYI
jgi:hypothetical protein